MSRPLLASITLEFPSWLRAELDFTREYATDELKMQLAIELAQKNIQRGGGPFGALVFDMSSQRLLSAGVNLVMKESCSVFHAEIVAIMFAQKALSSYTLSHGAYELVTSSEPCAQCLGAVCWSGAKRLVCGATVRDAETIGFDEGPLAPDWQMQLSRRGIEVVTGVLEADAARVLSDYIALGGLVYNAVPKP